MKVQKLPSSEDFVKLKFVTTPSLSRNGQKLIFAIRQVDEKKNQYSSDLFMYDVSQNHIIKFTSGNFVDTSPQFSPDGNKIAFLSSRGENGMQIFCIDVNGGEAIQVTRFPKGIINFVWSHDSQKIHLIARVKAEELEELTSNKNLPPSYVLEPSEFVAFKSSKEEISRLKSDPKVIRDGYYREGTAYLEGRYSQPFVINVNGFNDDFSFKPNHNLLYIGEIGFHYTLGVFTRDNSSIILSKFQEDPTLSMKHDIERINIIDPKNKELIGTAFGWLNNFQISPDGDLVSYETIREDQTIYDDNQVFLINLEKLGSTNIRCLTKNFPRSASQSQWISNDSLLFLSPSEGRININKIDIEDEKVDLVVSGDRNINSFSASLNNCVAFEVSHFSSPSDLYFINLENSIENRVTNVNQEYLSKYKPPQLIEIQFENGGFQEQAWLFLPYAHNGHDDLPVIFEVHGGPAVMWSPHERTMWHEWNTFVSNGYAVIFCNPRGSDGYGIEFRASCFKNWGYLPASDIFACIDTIFGKYSFLNLNQLFLTGGSYGGYMTTWLITQTNKFKAAVTQRGVYDYLAFSTTTDIPQWFERQYDGEIIDRFKEIWTDQPIAHVRSISTPLLIIHSENDFRVPIVSAEQLFWLCKRYNKEVEFVRYPRDGHELSRSGEPRHVIDRINRILNWFAKYNH
ncbi:S9 family peptidase [Candidatus Hodarchaeum mangrovi]